MNIPNWFTWAYFIFVAVLIVILLIRFVYIIRKPVFAKGMILSSEEIKEIAGNINRCRKEVAKACSQVNLSREEIVKVFNGTSKVGVRKEKQREPYMIRYSSIEPFGRGKSPREMQVKYLPEEEYLEFVFKGVRAPKDYIAVIVDALREYHYGDEGITKEVDWQSLAGRFAS